MTSSADSAIASDGGLLTASPQPRLEEILTITDAAAEVIAESLADDPDSEELGLRVAVSGTEMSVNMIFEYSYDLSLLPLSEVAEDDLSGTVADLTLIIPADSVEKLAGSEADRLTALLNNHVNPSLAAHGGYVELVKVQDSKAYLLMGGGCQGCAMSAATLHQGVAAIVMQHVPEIVDVIDVTDHNAGENPFY